LIQEKLECLVWLNKNVEINFVVCKMKKILLLIILQILPCFHKSKK